MQYKKIAKNNERFSSEQANTSENAIKAEDLESRSHGFRLQLWEGETFATFSDYEVFFCDYSRGGNYLFSGRLVDAT